MSIFSKIRGAKKAAAEHKDSKATTATHTEPPKPYRHVPTHAAVDALSGAPSSWKEEDRTAIKAANTRRQSLSRNTSDLSASSYMPRSVKSRHSFVLSERPRTAAAKVRPATSASDRLRPATSASDRQPHPGYRGYEGFAEPRRSPRSSRRMGKSPLSSAPITPSETPTASSSASSASSESSEDEVLELPNLLKRKSLSAINIFEHVHRSTTRKVGEAPILEAPPMPAVIQTKTPASRPATSRSWRFSRAPGMGGSTAIAAH